MLATLYLGPKFADGDCAALLWRLMVSGAVAVRTDHFDALVGPVPLGAQL